MDHIELLEPGQRAVHGCLDTITILRVDRLHERPVRALPAASFHPEDAIDLVRPANLLFPEIPDPIADMRDALCQGQFLLAAVQRMLGTHPLRDVQDHAVPEHTAIVQGLRT